MAVAGAGAGAEIMVKVGAGAEINNFGFATLLSSQGWVILCGNVPT